MPFETFVYAHTLTLASPPPPPPTKKKCQIRIPCQFMEKYPPPPPQKEWILCKKKSLTRPHRPTRPDHTHLLHIRPIFVLMWIICQRDSVLVYFFYKVTKGQNLKKMFFFFWGGGGEGGCGGGEHNVQMFKMALLLF